MDEESIKRYCLHEEISLGMRQVTGPNLLGYNVTCTVEDLICKKCGLQSVKIISEERRV